MITVTFQCDFGPETMSAPLPLPLPQGWAYAYLNLGTAPADKMYLCCPNHQNLQITLAPAPVVVVPAPVVSMPAPAEETQILTPTLTSGS